MADKAAAADRIEEPPLPADALPVVPVRHLSLFPGTVMPISLGREISIAAAQ
jgi:ATP-dependent Lon protease